jgi:hypothetical protein
VASIITTSEIWFRRLLWLVVVYTVVVSIVALADLIVHPFAQSPYPSAGGGPESAWSRWLIPIIGGIPTFIIGFMVLRRAPRNNIALLLLIWGGSLVGFAISNEVSPWVYNLVSLPMAAYWVALLFIPLYFPNGNAYPCSWGIAFTLYYALQIPLGWLALARLEVLPLSGSPANPWFIPETAPLYTLLLNLVSLASVPLILALFISPVLRYRQASTHERQQIKWLAWGGGLVFAPYFAIYLVAVTIFPSNEAAPIQLVTLVRFYQIVVGLYPAFTIGNAILRHKLYDIDIIIRRTLIYTVLTTILGIVYFGGIVLTQQLFRALTGQSSELAIVVSTLLIAALFAPLRRRVQDVIDRRLYRKKYNAEKVLADFQKNLRDEVDMETLKANLIGVLEDTMQPTRIALWVKEPKS